MSEVIRKIQPTLAFRRAAITDREETRQVGVGCTVFRINDQIGRAISEDEPGANDDAKIAVLFLVV